VLVRHVMTSDPFTMSPNRTCHEALVEFRRRKIRRAPVVENGRLIGIISERDLLRVLPGTCGQASTLAGEDGIRIPVRNIMTTQVATLVPNDHLAQAAGLMLTKRIGGVPVVHEGRLKGIITESDVFRALYSILAPNAGSIVIFEEPIDAVQDNHDYVRLCLKHNCRLNTFLRYPKPDGGTIYYFSFEGKQLDGLVQDLWAMANRVIWAEEIGAPRGRRSP
jgi:acetoin utilization protein AcuB